MHWIEELRNKYHLPQDALALYLEVSRSTLSMVELNKRDLSGSAMIALAPLLETKEAPLSGEIAARFERISQQDLANAATATIDRQKQYGRRLALANHQLAMMEEKYAQGIQLFQLAQRIAELPPLKRNQAKKRSDFINFLLIQATAMIDANGIAAQAKVKLNIRVYTLLANDEEW